jgi:hypothetical protein
MADAALSDDILMTLAGIAYGAPQDIATYISKAAPVAGWRVGWMPEVPEAPPNFAFLAVSPAGQAVVAIRGTYPDPFSSAYWDDGNQDSPFGDMADWPGAARAKISGGTNEGFSNLLKLADASGTGLEQAVAKLPAGASVTVTGHSLGGTLTPVLALKLAGNEPGRPVFATSYAGMTPGNAEFAALFGPGTALHGKVRRVYNTIDSVGYGWDQVFATHSFFDPAPKGGDVVSALLLATAARLKLGGYDYAAIGEPVPLKGVVRPPEVSCNLVAYVFETLHQHMPDTYLSLLGAPPLPFSILFATLVAPKSDLAKAISPDHHFPVVHLR